MPIIRKVNCLFGQTVKLTTITTFGLKRNEYCGQVQSSITIDDLF